MMVGLCYRCSAPAMFTCTVCGKLICINCYDKSSRLCKDCLKKFSRSDIIGPDNIELVTFADDGESSEDGEEVDGFE